MIYKLKNFANIIINVPRRRGGGGSLTKTTNSLIIYDFKRVFLVFC